MDNVIKLPDTCSKGHTLKWNIYKGVLVLNCTGCPDFKPCTEKTTIVEDINQQIKSSGRALNIMNPDVVHNG